MTPRSFFTIVIKIMGLYLVLDSIIVVPDFVSSLSTLGFIGSGSMEKFMMVLLVVLVFALYFLVLRYCLFKTDWIIDKLVLDKHFTEDKFELNISRSSVLSIAIIAIGALIFIDALPYFCKAIYGYAAEMSISHLGGASPTVGRMIFYLVKMVIAYFMMTNHRLIVNFIDKGDQ